MKFFILKRKNDGSFLTRNGSYIHLPKGALLKNMVLYREDDLIQFGKIWENVFEFILLLERNEDGLWMIP